MTDTIHRSAVISESGLYRYELHRTWDPMLGRMTFVMLNPSTADAENDDPTIRRCMGFARREGWGGIEVVNLFAFRATSTQELRDAPGAGIDVNGPDNFPIVEQRLAVADVIVAAWGAWPFPHWSEVYNELFDWEEPAYRYRCLGKTADGSPRHPLYLRRDQPLEMWP